MALVISQGIAYGTRGGAAVAAGILIADMVLTLLVVVGVAATLAAWPGALRAIQVAGALYLGWLGMRALGRRPSMEIPEAARKSTSAIVGISVLTSLLNPKALVFFLVFLPQFVEEDRGRIALQLTVLGATLACLAFLFHVALGVAASHARRHIALEARHVRRLDRLQALVFFGLAVRLLVSS